MPQYLVNTQPQANGDHEVHESSCNYLPAPHHRKQLGFFTNCADAVREAKKTYPRSNGCYYCSRPCNTG